ncbi:hypothetical protein [Paenibacillus sp. Soil522]|uniref:hypothetical protein n=1 Tax=Paenibacillus sp. Soil522 TaxID=1736388 RepID=UPI0006F480AD|nr:hypothetical protein [Paenibacillus sp. Soil522]KRE53628.1 hypothetical protein ASG81_02385 [Paenibacillus sp. Soil522]
MWPVAAVLAVGTLIFAIEAPTLMKTSKRKELWVFSVLLLAGIALCIAVNAGVKVISPLEWIRFVYEPISKSILGK